MSRHSRRGLAALCAFLLLVALAVAVGLLGRLLVVQDAPANADAIVVIGGDHKPQRVQQAVALYRQGYASTVIISAGTLVREGSQLLPEGEVMRRQAVALGLPAGAIILETQSRSTLENAVCTKAICQERGLRSILLVTSAYHSRRARRIFGDVFAGEITVRVVPAIAQSGTVGRRFGPDDMWVILYECKNWVSYWLSHVVLSYEASGLLRFRSSRADCEPPAVCTPGVAHPSQRRDMTFTT